MNVDASLATVTLVAKSSAKYLGHVPVNPNPRLPNSSVDSFIHHRPHSPRFDQGPHLSIMSGRQQRVMVQPIVSGLLIPSSLWPAHLSLECDIQKPSTSKGFIFRFRCFLSRFQKTKIVIWLYDNIEMRIEGRIIVCVPDLAFSAPPSFNNISISTGI